MQTKIMLASIVVVIETGAGLEALMRPSRSVIRHCATRVASRAPVDDHARLRYRLRACPAPTLRLPITPAACAEISALANAMR